MKKSQVFRVPSALLPAVLPEAERVSEVPHVEVVQSVALPFEGQDGIGSQPDAAVHPGGEVNPEEGEPRVRDLQRNSAGLRQSFSVARSG